MTGKGVVKRLARAAGVRAVGVAAGGLGRAGDDDSYDRSTSAEARTAPSAPRISRKVLVLECRDRAGGACITEELFPGYRCSASSNYYYLLQAMVIVDLELRRHGFPIAPLDPLECSGFPDGRVLPTWDGVEETQEAIGWLSRHHAETYPRWETFWNRAAAPIYQSFLDAPPTIAELAAAQRTSDDRTFLRAAPDGERRGRGHGLL